MFLMSARKNKDILLQTVIMTEAMLLCWIILGRNARRRSAHRKKSV